VDPTEIESALTQISGIIEAAVVGIPDPEWGQKVVALVVRQSNVTSLSEEKIISELKKKLSGYKIPKEIRFTGSLPKTSMGKIRRGELASVFDR